jgi:hypothetical protein
MDRSLPSLRSESRKDPDRTGPRAPPSDLQVLCLRRASGSPQDAHGSSRQTHIDPSQRAPTNLPLPTACARRATSSRRSIWIQAHACTQSWSCGLCVLAMTGDLCQRSRLTTSSTP